MTSLVFLFAVLFGLATDYAVLVMARIKEQHDLGDSNEEAVAIGIARTGRVITAAALMIAVVFLAFGVSSVFFMKQIAVGMAVGVLLDATDRPRPARPLADAPARRVELVGAARRCAASISASASPRPDDPAEPRPHRIVRERSKTSAWRCGRLAAVNFVEDVLERSPASRLGLVAIDSEGNRRDWHFGELIARSAGLSGAFAAHGVRRGDVVMTLVGNRVEWVLALLACWRMGAVALPCNTQLRRHDLELRANAAAPKLCVGEERCWPSCPAACRR